MTPLRQGNPVDRKQIEKTQAQNAARQRLVDVAQLALHDVLASLKAASAALAKATNSSSELQKLGAIQAQTAQLLKMLGSK